MSETNINAKPPSTPAAGSAMPPIGVQPEYIWKLHRIQELSDSISRYVQAGCYWPCVAEWAEELGRHIQEQNK
jgi:hypothetical protein